MTTTARSLPTTPLPRPTALTLVLRGAMAFGLTLLALVAFFMAFAAGYAAYHANGILPGVQVAGVALDGLDAVRAEALLRARLPALSGGALTISVDGQDHRLAYSEVGRDYDFTATYQRAVEVGQGDSLLTTFQHQIQILAHGVSIAPSVTWDNDRLLEKLNAIIAANTRPARDATIMRDGGHFVAQPAVEGTGVDTNALLERVFAVLSNPAQGSQTIELTQISVPPAIPTEVAQQAAASAEATVGSGLDFDGVGTSATIPAETLRGWVHIDQSGAGPWPVVVEREPIVQYLNEFAATADHPPVDAHFEWHNGGVRVVPAAAGESTDVQAGADRIVETLNARGSGANLGVVTLPTSATPATFSTEQAQAIVDQVRNVGEWTTHFTPSRFNGNGVNIRIPTEAIDGTVLMPGEKFDFWDVVGELSPDKGYVMGAAIIRGHLDPDGALGGGMCSVSTTVFNAGLRAGLDIRARRNHALYYTRYPLGLDATVWITRNSRLTTSFVNDTQYPVFIRGIAKRKTVTFQIWTVPTGRKVVLTDPIKTKVKQPDYRAIQYTDSLAEGTRKLVDARHVGMNVSVTRYVYDREGNLIHEDLFTSRYRMTPQLHLVGRGPDDPPDGTVKKIYD